MELPGFVVHIGAGSVALVSGYAALFAPKGALVHRGAGVWFVWSMLVMCAAGFALALLRQSPWSVINTSAATLTAYLVATSFITVRRPAIWTPTHDALLTLLAVAVCAVTLPLGVVAAASGGSWRGIPAFPFFLFGIPGTLAVIGDFHVRRHGPLAGSARLRRHLWRMLFALFVAAMSFFIGQMKVFPEPMRIPVLLAIPPLTALAALAYWMWRHRARRARSAIARTTAAVATKPPR